MAEILNLAAQNGKEPAEPEKEEDRNEWLQGDLELRDEKREQFQTREKEALAFFQGRDDDPRTAKPAIVSNAEPTNTAKSTSTSSTSKTTSDRPASSSNK